MRARLGRAVPKGFPRSNSFGPGVLSKDSAVPSRPAREALDEVGAGSEEAGPVGDADTDVVHFRSDQMFAVTRRVEPHPERTLGRGPVASSDVFSHSDDLLTVRVAAFVAAGGRAAAGSEVIEIAAPRHVLRVIEGCR